MLALLLSAACAKDHGRDDPQPNDGSVSAGRKGPVIASGGPVETGGDRAGSDAVPTSGPVNVVLPTNAVDKLDLLFVIDNSNSMAAEQEALREQLPRLIQTLTTGQRTPDDPAPFPPVKDLHVGVVSTDLGIPGVNFGSGTGCSPDGGDDGKLQHTSHPAAGLSCADSYPTFLSYSAQQGTDRETFASDLACIANLGTGGCGFEMQLEAPLKALWPSVFADGRGNVVTPNPITFLATTVQGTMGRGDLPTAQGGNLGFLRNDVNTGLSLVAVVLVTDEEDCSSKTTEHLKPTTQLDQSSPYYRQDINLRCFYNKDLLYNVTQRYMRGLRLLRDGHEELVVFAAIAGVPTNLVDAAALDFDYTDAAARGRFYRNILEDPRMIEEIDPVTNPGMGTGNVKPSCSRIDKNGQRATASPPRRIVELAEAFGENGIVQSICQDDFGPALDSVVGPIARQLGATCLPRPMARKSNKVACNVIWELPAPGTAPMTTPIACALDWLRPADKSRSTNERGGKNCVVEQLAVTASDLDDRAPPAGTGWYYDDYSRELESCRAGSRSRISFTPEAKPPAGVVVKLECAKEPWER